MWLLLLPVPEGAEELRRFPADLLHLRLDRLPEGGLAALGVFDVLIQTALQGGAETPQSAETQTVSPRP